MAQKQPVKYVIVNARAEYGANAASDVRTSGCQRQNV